MFHAAFQRPDIDFRRGGGDLLNGEHAVRAKDGGDGGGDDGDDFGGRGLGPRRGDGSGRQRRRGKERGRFGWRSGGEIKIKIRIKIKSGSGVGGGRLFVAGGQEVVEGHHPEGHNDGDDNLACDDFEC